MVREILHAQTLKIRAEVLSLYIRTAKVHVLCLFAASAQCTLMHRMYLFLETVRHEQSPRSHGCHICATKCSHLQTQQNMGGEYIFLLSDRFISRLVSINI